MLAKSCASRECRSNVDVTTNFQWICKIQLDTRSSRLYLKLLRWSELVSNAENAEINHSDAKYVIVAALETWF